jgi:uncharacterized protein (DUF952 family)
VTTIYKICERSLWRKAQAEQQFAGLTDLVLVAVDADALGGALKWETSRGGELFPHLYAPLPLTAVRWTRPLPEETDGRRVLPELPEIEA